MSASNLDLIRSIYDQRGQRYDESAVHVQQAKDYIKWAELKKGENVLDLACGTGLVALSAKQIVGQGIVVGVDISDGMLDVARRKAEAATLDVQFTNHDISDLSTIKLPAIDLVTCASALILLDDPEQAIKGWSALLRPGGRLITDVQTADANVAMNILATIGPEVGERLPWAMDRWRSREELEKVVRQAGLTVKRLWGTEAYSSTTYDDAEELFDQTVNKSMFSNFGKASIRDRAKRLFTEKFKELAGPSATIEEQTKFWMVIADKPL